MDGKESPLFHQSFEVKAHPATVADLEMMGHETVFVMSGAAEWIKNHRKPALGPLDIEATAESLGIPLSFDLDGVYLEIGATYGLPGSMHSEESLAVELLPGLKPADQRTTFGHELGHIFLATVLKVEYVRSRQIEDFCDIFGYETVLPRRELDVLDHCNEEAIRGLIDAYDLDAVTVLHQLAWTGRIPRKFTVIMSVSENSTERHAGQIVKDVFCLDCARVYGSCELLDENVLPVIDLRMVQDALKMNRHCRTQKTWWDDLEAGELLIYQDEGLWL